MKKRVFALIFAALLTGTCCFSCGDSGRSRRSDRSDSEDEIRVSKSRVQSACADAKSMMTLANQALAEMDEEGIKITLNGWYDRNSENNSDDSQWQDVFNRMCTFGDAAKKCEFSVYIGKGACLSAVTCKRDNFGFYPGGLTADDYEEKFGKDLDFDDAKAAAEEAYKDEHNGEMP